MATPTQPSPASVPMPVWEVLKEHIAEQIARGVYPVGGWLPSVRGLSDEIGVNRNTVSKAYHVLGLEGLVEATRGRGVRVVRRPEPSEGGRARIEAAIVRLVREAGIVGLSGRWILDRVGAAVHTLVETTAPRLAFIECTMPDARKLAGDLATALDVSVTPVDLGDALREPRLLAEEFDMVTTTFFHYQEVNALMAPLEVQVAGIHHTVSYESIKDVARIPPKSRVVVACPNDRTIARVRSVVEGYSDAEIVAFTGDQVADLRRALTQADVAIGMTNTLDLLSGLAPQIPVIALSFRIEESSIDELRERITSVRENKISRLTQD